MNYTTMKEITKDEFYKIINDNRLDVVVYPKTNEPGHYWTFNERSRQFEPTGDYNVCFRYAAYKVMEEELTPCFHGRGFAVCAP